jgi:hypothetical protein
LNYIRKKKFTTALTYTWNFIGRKSHRLYRMFIWYIGVNYVPLHKRILLIENGIDQAILVAERLSSKGYIVDILDPVSAEIAFQKNPDRYNIVIADVLSNPSVDFRLFRALNREIKILAVTASDVNFEVQIDALLRKPIHVDLLAHMVSKLGKPTVTLSNTYCL